MVRTELSHPLLKEAWEQGLFQMTGCGFIGYPYRQSREIRANIKTDKELQYLTLYTRYVLASIINERLRLNWIRLSPCHCDQ